MAKRKINWNKLSLKDLEFKSLGHVGNNVSHAKNRTSRTYRRNLHRATVVLNGVKHKIMVPTGILRKLKQLKLTTHHRAE